MRHVLSLNSEIEKIMEIRSDPVFLDGRIQFFFGFALNIVECKNVNLMKVYSIYLLNKVISK